MTNVSCTVGPDYVRPETAADDGGGFINTPAGWADANDICLSGPWWQCFGDPVIAELVDTALENNTDLRAAAARVVEARALLAQSHGIRLPGISYSANRTRSKIPMNFLGTRISSLDTAYSQDFSISYIVDFFGKLKRSEQAALADMLATEASRQALKHAIIAQIVRTRVQIATQQRLFAIAQVDIESRRNTLEIIERRYNSGLVGPLDVYLAKENLASARALEPQIIQSLYLAQHSLDVLTGRRPASSKAIPETLPEMPELTPIPIGLPAALLDRRPDVRSAEMRLAAATERVGVSIAAMFPDLTLSGSTGFRSDTFSMLTNSENEAYSAIIALAAPIFKGGQLKAGVDAAKARVEQAAADYAGVVLVAVREVEDALVREKMLKKRIDQLQERLSEATRAESLAKDRYFKGVEKILMVLETERRRRLAENELILTTGNIWNARVELFLALGGNWDVGLSDSRPKNLGVADAKIN